jgi:mRNA interferase RelE/StbE
MKSLSKSWGLKMKYKVVYERKAETEIRKMDKGQSRLLLSWINRNLSGTDNPRLRGKPLQGGKKGYWRYRVGMYRLIAKIDDDQLIIIMVDVGHRRHIYK